MKKKVILIDPCQKLIREDYYETGKWVHPGDLIGVSNPGGSMPVKDESGIKHMMWSGLYHYSPTMEEMPAAFQIHSLYGDAVFFGKCVFIAYPENENSENADVRYPLEYFAKHLRLISQEQALEEYQKIMDKYEKMFEL